MCCDIDNSIVAIVNHATSLFVARVLQPLHLRIGVGEVDRLFLVVLWNEACRNDEESDLVTLFCNPLDVISGQNRPIEAAFLA